MTFFAGNRDYYQLPLALHEADLLERFVTEFYWPADRAWFRAGPGRWVGERAIASRSHPDLPSSKVAICRRALAARAAMRLSPKADLNAYTADALGRAGRRIANRTNSAIFAYSYYVSGAFAEGPDRPPLRFIFQLHPHPKSVRRILLEELDRHPQAEASLRHEAELRLTPEKFEALASEPHLANGWAVASQFTASTLAEQGIPRDRIHVIPYGVDPSRFPQRERPPAEDRPLRVIFVGSMVQRKGLADLLEAMRLMRTQRVELVLCGRGFVDTHLLSEYSDVEMTVIRNASQEDLVAALHASDVFVFPSLVEGFAHVILEAMASGLPVIATEHTCAPDVIDAGVHGFIVPIRSPAAIAERLAWGIENRAALAAMGAAAAVHVRSRFTWERFRSGVREAYLAMLSSEERSGSI